MTTTSSTPWIGRYAVLYPAIGVLVGLAMLLLALLLFSAVHPRFKAESLIVFSALLLLVGLVDRAWNQARLIFHQR